MTVSAVTEPVRSTAAGDRLVPFAEASARLGRSTDTLRNWHTLGCLPAVVSPGGQWSTYESFIADVIASARPKQAGEIEKIARAWFTARGVDDDVPEAVA
jgi:hypothetical protein